MIHQEFTTPSIALVRTFSKWENREYIETALVKTTERVIDGLGSTGLHGSKYVLPQPRDDRIGRTSYYLNQSFQRDGNASQAVDSAELSEAILHSRLDFNRDHVRLSLVRICALVEELTDWTPQSRLVLVTSEPFMNAARSISTDDRFLRDISPIEPGHVITVAKDLL